MLVVIAAVRTWPTKIALVRTTRRARPAEATSTAAASASHSPPRRYRSTQSSGYPPPSLDKRRTADPLAAALDRLPASQPSAHAAPSPAVARTASSEGSVATCRLLRHHRRLC